MKIIKIFRGKKSVPGLKVVSVGNLTVGGTGKTVFIKFLAQHLGIKKSAIVSRGYGSNSTKKNILVCDGDKILCTPQDCGDEPYMLAKNLSIVAVTGSDRYKSCQIIHELYKDKKYILLDDAYQNFQLKKDFEILLIDARFPRGINDHCLPAGDLRELDYSRSDVIILTHTDLVEQVKILEIKTKYFPKFNQSKIFCGRHKPSGIFHYDAVQIDANSINGGRMLLVAGVGSFSGFAKSVVDFGLRFEISMEFGDHHSYIRSDIDSILQKLKNDGLDAVITTQKDWVKLEPMLDSEELKYFFVFRVEFEFLSEPEYISFIDILESRLK